MIKKKDSDHEFQKIFLKLIEFFVEPWRQRCYHSYFFLFFTVSVPDLHGCTILLMGEKKKNHSVYIYIYFGKPGVYIFRAIKLGRDGFWMDGRNHRLHIVQDGPYIIIQFWMDGRNHTLHLVQGGP